VTKRKEKTRRARARSTAGRPRKEGDRYPSGKLKPPLPNQRVIAERRILLGGAGDISKAENPLDLMLARGWITEDEHRAGRAYAFLYIKAGIDLPRLKTADLRESGSIEQDADVVMFVYREAYYLGRAEPATGTAEHQNWVEQLDRIQNVAELIIGKQRHGPIGTVKLHFNADLTKFGNLAREGRFQDRAHDFSEPRGGR
jgi:hypothetical protein